MSLTYIGIITSFVGYLFQLAGIPFAPADFQTTISFIVSFVGVIIAIYGRYRKGDLTIYGFRK